MRTKALTQPAVSIIIPAHNAEEFIARALDDIRQQSLQDFEVWLVNDGSTDKTQEICEHYARTDSRFHVIDGPRPGGISPARNAGLAQACGSWVIFLDADDRFDPSLVDTLYQAGQHFQADVVITGYEVRNWLSPEQVTGTFLPRLKPLGSPLAATTEAHLEPVAFTPAQVADHLFQITTGAVWNKMFRREYLTCNHYVFQPVDPREDTLFTFSAMAQAGRIAVVNKPLVTYYTGRSTSHLAQNRHRWENICQALDALWDCLEVGPNQGLLYTQSFRILATDQVRMMFSRLGNYADFLEMYARVRQLLHSCSVTESTLSSLPKGLRDFTGAVLTKSSEEWLFDRQAQLTRLLAASTQRYEEASSQVQQDREDIAALTKRLRQAEDSLADATHRLADTDHCLTDTAQRLAETSQELADSRQALASLHESWSLRCGQALTRSLMAPIRLWRKVRLRISRSSGA